MAAPPLMAICQLNASAIIAIRHLGMDHHLIDRQHGHVHRAKPYHLKRPLSNAGLNSANSSRVDGVLFDRSGGQIEVEIGTAARSFSTGGYEELANGEKERDQEEYVRLLYVATTRARDHLVLSMYRTSNDASSAASTIAQYLNEQDHLWESLREFQTLPAGVSEAASSQEELDGHTLDHRVSTSVYTRPIALLWVRVFCFNVFGSI